MSEYTGGAWIHQGDALDMPLQDESVDLIVTSPPYFALRSYTDGGEHYDGQIGSEPTPADFLVALWRVLDECWRVLKPGGSCWVNLGDKYSTGSSGESQLAEWGAVHARGGGHSEKTAKSRTGRVVGMPPKSLLGLPWRWVLGASCPDPYRTIYDPGVHPQWVLRAEVVWSKPNGLPESVTDRVRRSHEQWFHLTKDGRYFAAVDEVREPASGYHRESVATTEIPGQRPRTMLHTSNPLGKLPGSVWTVPSEPLRVPEHLGVNHFAAFPQEWPRRIILGWSPSGICEACGEPLSPVSEKRANGETLKRNRRHIPGYEDPKGQGQRGVQYRITGYTCDCEEPWSDTELSNARFAMSRSSGGATAGITRIAGTTATTTPATPTTRTFRNVRPAVVLDPFGGTGTTAMVARALGRFGISLDLSSDYNRLARWRVWQSGHEYKTLARMWAEKNGAMVDGKPKVPAKIKREIEAEMSARKVAQIRQSKALWESVHKGPMDVDDS